MISKLNSENHDAPKSSQKAGYIVFCVVCALVIGVVAWVSDPLSPLTQNGDAKDSLYNLLVQGFKAGQLNLIKPVPPGLAKLSDPYNPNANAAYIKDLTDISYYKGKFYVYFGVTPVLILYLPYTLLTGHYLSDKVAVIIFFTIGFLMMMVLIRAIWRRYFPTLNPWMGAMVAFGLSLALALTLGGNKNEVARTCGFAFGMLALCAIWSAMHSQGRRALWLALASLAYGLAIGARPSLLFGIIILLIPVAQACGRVSLAQICLLMAAAIVPVAFVGLGLALYNDLRFDNPFEFGWHYQLLNYEAPTARQYGLNYLWFNIRYYYFEPLHWSSHFPFLQGNSMPSVPSGYFTQTADPVAGILINYPAVLSVLAVPWVWKGESRDRMVTLRWFIGAIVLLFAACVMTLNLFFTASKAYEMDFLPPLLLLTLIGILGLESGLRHRWVWRYVVRCGLCLSLIFSVVLNLLENIEAHAVDDCLVGNSFLSLGRLDEALAQYQKALALWPDSADAQCGLGSVLLQKGYANEAMVHYEKALETRPYYAEASYNLGYCLLQKGEIDNAIIQYQKAVTLRPESAFFHNGLGNAFFQKGKVNDAATEYQKAVEIEPDFTEAHNNLGYCFLQEGQINDSIIQHRKAVELQPQSATSHNALGNALCLAGNLDEAIGEYLKALELAPNFAEARCNLGNAYRRKGMAAEAVASYREAIKLQPQLTTAQNSLAWILATWPEPSIRNGKEAVALAEKANELSGGNDQQIIRTLAAAYAEAGHFPEAVAAAKKALGLAGTQSNTALINELKTEIGRYQNGVPWRSTNN